MANTISTPSWREDQPWAIEQGLANSLGARSPNLAETMLTRYGIERQGNQAAYHDYMRAINALQGQALSDSHSEARTKLAMELGEKAAQHGGLGQYYATNANTSDLAGGDMSLLNENAMNLSGAKQTHDIGLGLGGMGASGADQRSMAQVANQSPYTAGMTFLQPAVVQAQAEANKGRFAQAAATAGNVGRVNQTVNVPATPDNAGGNASGRRLPGETYEQAQQRILNQATPRTLGENGARDVGNLLPPAKRDTPVTNVPPNLQGPIPGTQPRTASPTPAQAQETANRTVAQWHQSVGNPELKQRAREVYEFSVANGKGGVPILSPELHNGRPAVLGRGGTPYTLQ